MHVPNRTYLWVHLTLDLIESDIDIDKTGIANATSHLPKTVYEAYDRILSKSHDSKKAKRILHIIVAAARPLTLREMALALSIRRNHRSYSDVDLKPEDRFRESVRDICGLFVTIIDSRIYLLHQTAKEFLVQNDQEIHPLLQSGPGRPRASPRGFRAHRPTFSEAYYASCLYHTFFSSFLFLSLTSSLCIAIVVLLAYSGPSP
jgi:GPI inositol-deacylase-like protein